MAGMRRRLSVNTCDPVAIAQDALENVEDMKEKIQAQLSTYVKEQKLVDRTHIALVTTKTDTMGKRSKSMEEKELDGGQNHLFRVAGDSVVSATGDSEAFARERGVAYMCRKGKKPESPNQDSLSLLMVDGKFNLYGVYDGHGPDGHTVSNIATKMIVAKFLEEFNGGAVPHDAFTVAFEECQSYFDGCHDAVGKKVCEPSFSGTTCTMALHNLEEQTLTIASAGDSRAVFGSWEEDPTVLLETEDHKPDLEHEKNFIESKGGRVVFDGYFNHRVFAKGATYPGLNMSRALGDVVGNRQAGIRATPDVIDIDLTSGEVTSRVPGKDERKHVLPGFAVGKPLMLLLCTDGVWEFIDNSRALKTVKKQSASGGHLRAGLQKLIQDSWDEWMADSDNEISDDITAIAIEIQ